MAKMAVLCKGYHAQKDELMNEMHMIRFDAGGVQFNMRLVAVMIEGDRVLVHRAVPENFWSLPGGRAELLETAREGLAREMMEELDTKVEVGRLLWVVENFFEYGGTPFHELAFYFLVTIPPGSVLTRKDTFSGHEEGIELTFLWVNLGDLDSMTLYPSFFQDSTAQSAGDDSSYRSPRRDHRVSNTGHKYERVPIQNPRPTWYNSP